MTPQKVKQHFVTFLSPGTFVVEDRTQPIESWDVEKARNMAEPVKERYGAIPYGFYFTTRGRGEDDLDSKEIARSGTYYLPHCVVETLAQVKAKHNPADSILISNMECNGYKKVVTTTKGWKWTQPFEENDVLLEAQ